MKKYHWYLICELDFILIGMIFASAGHPITFWMLFMAAWMCKKTIEQAWREHKKR